MLIAAAMIFYSGISNELRDPTENSSSGSKVVSPLAGMAYRQDGPAGPGFYPDQAGVAISDPYRDHFSLRAFDLNRADRQLLETLPGIGPELAGGIIMTRERKGGFRTVDELLEVRGIGPRKLAGIRDRVKLAD